MDRVYFIPKTQVIEALEAGCRVYYTEKGKTDVFEFTECDSLSELKNTDYILAVKKG